eukprot:787346-Amphidinium_carterae.1
MDNMSGSSNFATYPNAHGTTGGTHSCRVVFCEAQQVSFETDGTLDASPKSPLTTVKLFQLPA